MLSKPGRPSVCSLRLLCVDYWLSILKMGCVSHFWDDGAYWFLPGSSSRTHCNNRSLGRGPRRPIHDSLCVPKTTNDLFRKFWQFKPGLVIFDFTYSEQFLHLLSKHDNCIGVPLTSCCEGLVPCYENVCIVQAANLVVLIFLNIFRCCASRNEWNPSSLFRRYSDLLFIQKRPDCGLRSITSARNRLK